jgi:hypothetical protein
MKVKYVGDPRDGFAGPEQITHLGVTFKKGAWTTIADDHEFAGKFRNNETFVVQGALDHDGDGKKGGSAPKAADQPKG